MPLVRSRIANIFLFSFISISNDKLIVDWATGRRSFYHCVNCGLLFFFFVVIHTLHIPSVWPLAFWSVHCTLFFISISPFSSFICTHSLTRHLTWFLIWHLKFANYSRCTHMVAKFFTFIICSRKMFMQSNRNMLLFSGCDMGALNTRPTRDKNTIEKQQENSISRYFKTAIVSLGVVWCFVHFNDRNRNRPFANICICKRKYRCVRFILPNRW